MDTLLDTLVDSLMRAATVGRCTHMWNRILLIVRTHLAGEWMGEKGSRLPVAPILFQASLAFVLFPLALVPSMAMMMGEFKDQNIRFNG